MSLNKSREMKFLLSLGGSLQTRVLEGEGCISFVLSQEGAYEVHDSGP